MKILRALSLGLAIVVSLLLPAVVVRAPIARADQPSEYEVKAAFLYNFAKFVTWPSWKFDGDDSPIVIGILGNDPFGKVIDESIRDKTIEGRPLRVERLAESGDREGVHLLFLARADDASLDEALDRVDRAGVLIVGETEGFSRRYGAIGFVLEEDRVRFEVNLDAAEESGLKISSKLLQLAKVVQFGKAAGR